MSSELKEALIAGVVVIAAAYWWLNRQTVRAESGYTSAGTFTYPFRPYNDSPDRILSPGESGAVWV